MHEQCRSAAERPEAGRDAGEDVPARRMTQPCQAMCGGVRIATSTAAQYNALRQSLHPWLGTTPTPFYTLDQLSGLVYVLGGEVVGSPWTDSVSQDRSAALSEERTA